MKRFISYVLSAAMVLSVAIAPSYAASEEVATQLASGLYVHQNSFYSKNAEGDINENYFVYTPNAGCTSYLCYGNDVAGAASVARVFRLEGEAGNSLVAAINADYFNVSNGVPIGIEIKDGIIKSSSSFNFPEIGITADGKARIGRSDLNISLVNEDKDLMLPYVNYNKALSDEGGVVIFSKDFEDTNRAVSEKETLNILVEITGGEATANGTLHGRVCDIYTADSKQALQDGYLLVSTYTSSYVDNQEKMKAFEMGDEITVHFEMDASWEKVTQAFGGKEELVVDGEAKVYSDNTRAPRTAFGTKADGTMVIYTCDGRGAGGSKGLTLSEVARRMKQLGCTQAVNLDGGASTQAHVVFPGNTNQEQINVDSGTNLRSCGNYICFKNNLPSTGVVAGLYAYPNSYKIAADCSATLNIKAVDTNWHAVDISPEDITFGSSKLGSIDHTGLFTAGNSVGDETITVSFGKVKTEIRLSVVSDWPEVEANYQSGYIVASVTDPTGEGIPKSRISLTLDGEPMEFNYENGVLLSEMEEIDGKLHHVILEARSNTGHISRESLEFIANEKLLMDGSYEEIEVDLSPVFADMGDERWSTKYATYLYDQGIIAGSEKNGKRYYNPDSNMTRQEFAKVIVSWLGCDLSSYEEEELAFADNEKIASWALPSVKAAVSLGIMGGKSNNGKLNFDPAGSITRQEVMTVIGKILETGYGSADLSTFSDAKNVAPWAEDYVKTLVKLNVISGSNGKLLPGSPVTREQVAKIIFAIN